MGRREQRTVAGQVLRARADWDMGARQAPERDVISEMVGGRRGARLKGPNTGDSRFKESVQRLCSAKRAENVSN